MRAADAPDPGRAGKRDLPTARRRYAARGRSAREVLPPEVSARSVHRIGILGVLQDTRRLEDGPVSAFSREEAEGRHPAHAIGDLYSRLVGSSGGAGGWALGGPGRGSQKSARGTIALGGLNTLGDRAGGPQGNGWSRTVGRLGRRSGTAAPRVRPGTPEVLGFLSKSAIRREIAKHIAEVRFCYEQALLARPDLQGRVTVAFVISPSGVVQSSHAAHTTLNHPAAEACVVAAVRRWTFPSPEGGGVVAVNYPFVFARPGE